MQTEIEAKFLDVNHDILRAMLREMGAVCSQPMRTMRRKGFDFADNRLDREHNGWVRIRDEGDKITMSYKQLNDRTLEGTKEVCVTIDSFEQAEAFLQALGMEQKTQQITKRESWRLPKLSSRRGRT
jgi:adenylate cyclase, class 2